MGFIHGMIRTQSLWASPPLALQVQDLKSREAARQKRRLDFEDGVLAEERLEKADVTL